MPNPKIPAISIIIPTFNRSSALRWCLEHLELQTFRNFEVIVVDDGSTDDTAEAVALYKARSAMEITYVCQGNAGPAKARNTAIRLARSPICVFIGDDILCTPQFAELHHELHRKKPDEATCGLGLTQWDCVRQKLTPFMKFFERIQFAYSDLESGAAPDWRYFYTSNLSVKTTLLQRYLFNERFPKAAMEDMELAYRISQSEDLKIDFLPRALAFHYHPTTLKQACRRSITVGWSTHLFEECWPEAQILSRSPIKKAIKQTVGFTPLRLAMTSVLSWMASFYCNASLTGVLLASYAQIGYNKRAAETRLKQQPKSTMPPEVGGSNSV
jgi:GT2 family glycosyltransferase